MTSYTNFFTPFLTANRSAALHGVRADADNAEGTRNSPARHAGAGPIRTVLLFVLLTAMAAVPPMSQAATRWVEIQLTDNMYSEGYTYDDQQVLSNGCAVWGRISPIGESEVYGYRLVDGVMPQPSGVVQITDNSVWKSGHSVNDNCFIAISALRLDERGLADIRRYLSTNHAYQQQRAHRLGAKFRKRFRDILVRRERNTTAHA